MKTWIIEPRDPLIARDGRPFTADPGARAKSLPFPFPSTTTGTVRTRYGFSKSESFTQTLIDEVKTIEVKGPLLVELNSNGEISDWLLPAPADAVLLASDEKSPYLKQLVPLSLPSGAFTDLDDDLCPIGFRHYDEGSKKKPLKDAPRYWRKEQFLQWLAIPQDRAITINELGHSGPTPEARVHVGINPDTQAAIDGALYQTSGLEFTRKQDGKPLRLGLAVLSAVDVPSAFAPLGGEQRLSHWRASSAAFPDCPGEVCQAIKQNKACRVVLLTPAHFTNGFQPAWLLQSQHGITPQLIAAAVGRPQVVSGWDYEIRQPKPTRRLAPAGSVYFLKLNGDGDIDQWIKAIWMNCISDEAQDRLDGFGLAALGTWSGECKPMEVNK
jgi:CRISPR-associated protein Cmr3